MRSFDKTVSRLNYIHLGNPHTWKDGLFIERGCVSLLHLR